MQQVRDHARPKDVYRGRFDFDKHRLLLSRRVVTRVGDGSLPELTFAALSILATLSNCHGCNVTAP